MPRRAICTELPKAQHRLFPAGGVEDVEGGGHLHCYLHTVSLLPSQHKRTAVTEEADCGFLASSCDCLLHHGRYSARSVRSIRGVSDVLLGSTDMLSARSAM